MHTTQAYLKISRVTVRDMSVIVKFELSCTIAVDMIQLNLNLTGYTCMRHGLDKTCSSFHTCAQNV